MNKEEFIKECKKINIKITQEIYNKLLTYCNILIEWNSKFNLTTIIEKENIFLKHFFDSLCLNKAVNLEKVSSLCDIGSGAGLPGLVLKIVFKNIKVFLIESSEKKCKFLKFAINNLNLDNIYVINDRGEQVSKIKREQFDIVTCRAVSSLKVISEISIPMVKTNGYFLPLKSNLNLELKNSEDIIIKLNAKIEKIIEYNLPIELSKRSIVVIKKTGLTSLRYPREYNKIIKTS